MIEDAVISAYNSGFSLKEIKEKFGYNRIEIFALLKERGLKKRSANVRALKRLQNSSNDEFLLCRICGVGVKRLDIHLKLHMMSTVEYTLKFGESLFISASSQEKMSNSAIQKFNERPELREALRVIGRKNIQNVNARGLGWKMPKGYHTDEHKQHMSKLLTGRVITWIDKIKTSHWSKSDAASEIIERIGSRNKNFKRGYHHSIKSGKDEWYQSSFEQSRMVSLDIDASVIEWTKRHGIVIPYQFEGKEKRYFPDFLIRYADGRVVLEELKGWIRNQQQHDAKCSAAMAWCAAKGYSYIVTLQKREKRGKKN